ncbi:16S rRNA (adenine(1518)-N(6)/adenine(1519)-N(6))-dimethyltransferase RsmA [Sulfuricystis multivorans]|uniref:16S rRNA (adenine(1518)-N(6)/adenine(1519)-N(6))- dimethyltransferase RsmA n=1 Tax=Sulfuricystis multivorans TaxID=2211108 RepID=UPI000F8243D8|nr:16S rRNA (adenine(1518)-N(6)/adenine(1519)-N(6))-dimethyltransferase RsmA [Sulfuricystis multivorans]
MKAHQPRRRFGQNFLVSPGVIRKIVAAIAPRPGDVVVEIGPGLGALTAPLLLRLDHLFVIEIDRDLITHLRRHFPSERLTIFDGDALRFDFGLLEGDGPLKIVGNLPYNISSPLLFHLTRFADRIAEMHFMLQKEVVDRMVAAPGSGAYGRLSVMLQYRFQLERLFIVPPGAFDPAPKVDSAVVRMIPRKLGAGETARDEALFSRLVTAAFSQRRKMLRNTLKEFGGESLLAAQGIAPTARAEELPVEAYVKLSNALAAG